MSQSISTKPAESMDDYLTRLVELAGDQSPSIFELRVNLPAQGRADVPVAATKHMSVVLKAYASGGENALHAHVKEDHVFVVLQGAARFYGKNGALGALRRYQGIMLPRGSFYRFEADEAEPLVMLRIGAADLRPDPREAFARVDLDGRDMDAYSKENRQVDLIEGDSWFPDAILSQGG
jgi:mannose-6-phosphate isomerase-like protein (cupin superfamily)